ncbi:unnamed protein product, partial [Closterium sp. NIES-54]
WWWGLSTGDHPELIKARFASRAREPATLWDNPVKGKWQQCVRPSPAYADAPVYESTGYLQVFLDGGLNQQRISICNAVAVARLLNATLLIPHFQINPVWLDDSQFEDIFDIEHFMRYLQRDVLVVRQLPHKYRWSTREFYSTGVHQNRIKFAPMHATPEWYLKNVLPKLQRHGVVAIAPFTHRLAFDGLPPDVQRLRCRVNFHALRFVEPVRRLGKILVERLRDPNRRHVKRGVLFGKGGDVSSYGGKGKVGGIGEGAAEGEKTAAEKEAEDESEKAAEMAAAKAAEMVGQLQEEARGGAGAGVGEGGERAEIVSERREETKETFKEALAGEGEGKGGREGEEGVGGGDVSGAAGVRVIQDGKGMSGVLAGAGGDGDGDEGDTGGDDDGGGVSGDGGDAGVGASGGAAVTSASLQGSTGGIEAVEEDEGEEEGEGEAEGGGKRRLLQERRGGVEDGVSVEKGGGGKGGGRGGGAGVGRMGEEDSEEGSEGAFWSEDGVIDEAARERVRRALRAGREGRVVVGQAGSVTAGNGSAGNGSAGNGSGGNGSGGNGSGGKSSGVGKVEVAVVLDEQGGPVDGLSQIQESDEGGDTGDGEGGAGRIRSSSSHGSSGSSGSSHGSSGSSSSSHGSSGSSGSSGSGGNSKESDAGSSRLLSGRPLLEKGGGWGRREGKKKRYVAMHLRFDMDMVAHSACDYGETWAEREALSKYREYAWLGRVDKLRFSSDELRLAGKCPLTPEEVGLVLAALGFSAKTRLYVATYQVYGGEKRIAPLRRLFPWLEDKTSLATEEELRPFLGKASLLAALDFYVSRYSDVFVSASLGNMHNVMAAHRAYFGGLKTINFNGTLLATLLAAPPNTLNWNEFVRAVRIGHRSRMGKIKLRRAGQSIYTYPAPDCLCPVDVPPSQPTAGAVTSVANSGLDLLTSYNIDSAKDAEVATDGIGIQNSGVTSRLTSVRGSREHGSRASRAGMAARGRFGGVKRENEGFDFQYRMSVDNSEFVTYSELVTEVILCQQRGVTIASCEKSEFWQHCDLTPFFPSTFPIPPATLSHHPCQSLYSFLRALIAAALMARPLITARLHGSTAGGAVALRVDVKESLVAALGAAAALTGNLASGTSRARVLKLYAALSLMACIAALLPLLTGPLVYPEKWSAVRSSGSSSAEGRHNVDQLWTAVTTACIAIDMAGLHLPSFSTNLVSTAALQDAMVTTTTPGGHRVSVCTCTRMGRHLATFTRRPGSSLYTLATEPPQVAASAQVSASGPVAPPCSCCLLSQQTLLWHHRLGHPSLPRLRGMHSRLLVSGLPRSLPPLPPSLAPPCLPCVEGRQRAAPHSSSFPPTSAPLQTLHMNVWGPARVNGQGRERYFLLVVDDYTQYTTVFPLRSKGEVVDVLIPWIRAVRLQLRERFCQDLPVLRLHSDRGGEFSSDLLRDFCRREGILQLFTLPDSPQQNGIAERRIGLVMEVARTSMIHAAAPHFLWPFAVRYAAHQLNLWPRVSLPETSPTLRWTGKVGDASVFRIWGSRAFVRDTSADKLSARAISCVFLGFSPDAPGWQFYHPTSHRVFPSHDVTFDKSVPIYLLFPYRSAPPPPPPLFLAPGPPPVDPLPPQGPAPSGVSQVNPLPDTVPVEVAVGSCAAPGAASGGATSKGAEPGGAEPGVAEPGDTGSEGAGSGGAEPEGAESEGARSEGAEPRGAGHAGSGGAEPRGTASFGGPARAPPRLSPRLEPLSPQQLREWFAQRTRLRSEAAGAGVSAVGDPGAGGTGVTAGAGGTGGAAAAGTGGARTGGTGAEGTGGVGGAGAGDSTELGAAGAGGAGAVGAGARGSGAGGAGAIDPGAGGAGGTVRPRPYFVPLLQQIGGLTERCESESRPAFPVRTGRRVPRPRPPPVPGTHAMAHRPSSVPLRVPLPPPPESSLPAILDPESDRACAASPTVSRLLAIVVTDPSFESTAASALVAELVDFASTCRPDYASTLVSESESVSPPSVGGECALGTDVLEDRQEDFECLAAAVPRFFHATC